MAVAAPGAPSGTAAAKTSIDATKRGALTAGAAAGVQGTKDYNQAIADAKASQAAALATLANIGKTAGFTNAMFGSSISAPMAGRIASMQGNLGAFQAANNLNTQAIGNYMDAAKGGVDTAAAWAAAAAARAGSGGGGGGRGGGRGGSSSPGITASNLANMLMQKATDIRTGTVQDALTGAHRAGITGGSAEMRALDPNNSNDRAENDFRNRQMAIGRQVNLSGPPVAPGTAAPSASFAAGPSSAFGGPSGTYTGQPGAATYAPASQAQMDQGIARANRMKQMLLGELVKAQRKGQSERRDQKALATTAHSSALRPLTSYALELGRQVAGENSPEGEAVRALLPRAAALLTPTMEARYEKPFATSSISPVQRDDAISAVNSLRLPSDEAQRVVDLKIPTWDIYKDPGTKLNQHLYSDADVKAYAKTNKIKSGDVASHFKRNDQTITQYIASGINEGQGMKLPASEILRRISEDPVIGRLDPTARGYALTLAQQMLGPAPRRQTVAQVTPEDIWQNYYLPNYGG